MSSLSSNLKVLGGQFKSIQTSLSKESWYVNSSLIRHQVGLNGFNTEVFNFFKSKSNNIFGNMNWQLSIGGAPFTYKGDEPDENENAAPDGRLGILLAIAIVKKTATGSQGTLSMLDLKDLGQDEHDEYMQLFTEEKEVIDARYVRTTGYTDTYVFNAGFKQGGFPGPVILTNNDELQMVVLATDNMLSPDKTYNGKKGFITGAISWELNNKFKGGSFQDQSELFN
jgi:hypothetical protein